MEVHLPPPANPQNPLSSSHNPKSTSLPGTPSHKPVHRTQKPVMQFLNEVKYQQSYLMLFLDGRILIIRSVMNADLFYWKLWNLNGLKLKKSGIHIWNLSKDYKMKEKQHLKKKPLQKRNYWRFENKKLAQWKN